MPVSPKHKLIFTHIPKTAGQSIETSLGIFNERQGHFFKEYVYGSRPKADTPTHFTINQIKQHITQEQFDNYTKFSVIRNPFDKMVSEFAFKGNNGFIVLQPTFKEFIKELYSKFSNLDSATHFAACHYMPQYDFVHIKDKMVMDHLIRFENLENDLKEKIDLKIPHCNSRPRNPWSSYYDEATADMVREMYAKDFEAFGYDLLIHPL